MFDFVNSTYNGVLSILATLFGLSYPLVIGCIEKIDAKFNSTKLSERFMSETIFRWFKKFLVINLIIAVLFPFIMDSYEHSRILIGIQTIFSILMITFALKLYAKILVYYNVKDLHKEIIEDYRKAKEKNDKEGEERYFTQWVDLSSVLLCSVDDELVQSVHTILYEYVRKKFGEAKDKECIFDQYYYEGVSRINENLCKNERRPISVNNSNSILTSLIFHNSIISDTTYRYLWRNLRIQLYYDRDEWIMEYWKNASQRYELLMREITSFDIKPETGNPYTKEEIQENIWQRENFLEFHIMLCAMLVQQNKYDLVNLMLSFSNSFPPSYPLVPSNIGEIITIFNKINGFNRDTPLYYESKYKMPNMHGITDGQIIGAANCYLALLAYRVYAIQWSYGYERVLNMGTLPETLAELVELKDNLFVFKFWLKKVYQNGDLLSVVLSRSFTEELQDKKEQFGKDELVAPDELVDKMIREIESKMKIVKEEQSLSDDKVEKEKNELVANIKKALEPYEELIGSKFEQDTCYNLNSSVTMPFPNSAFLEKSDICYVDIAESMSSYMLDNFYHLFASSFYQEHSSLDYKISSDILFDALDKLQLNDQHYIILFGIYLDFYVGRINGLTKESNHRYLYNNTKILVLNCRTELFSQMMYIMKYDDRPFMKFYSPSKEDIQKYKLSNYNDSYGLWLSLLKISEHPELRNNSIEKQLGDKTNEYSLFTCIWEPKLFFKPKPYKMIRIKVKYRLTDEGEYNTCEDIRPFENS